MFPDFDYAGRIDRVKEVMTARGLDALLLSVGADLPYFTGYEAMPLERLTMLVVPAGGPVTLVVPRLEAPRVTDRGAFAIRAWEETEDPVAIVAGLIGGAGRVALGDTTWSTFLLALQGALPEARFEDASPLTRELRIRKSSDEIAYLREAAAATDRVVSRLGDVRFSGMTEKALAGLVKEMTIEEGHDTAEFASVGSGPNAASPHHEPTDRDIERGDVVVIDFGGRRRGYCSDTTRTFSVGEPEPEVAEAYAVLESAQREARRTVAPGVAAAAVDAAARSVIDAAGHGDRFIHRTGHGIGLEVHEHPYLVEGNDDPLEAGMTFSVEPGIYVADHWGLRIEDIVACTAAGVDELNDSDRRLRVVG